MSCPSVRIRQPKTQMQNFHIKKTKLTTVPAFLTIFTLTKSCFKTTFVEILCGMKEHPLRVRHKQDWNRGLIFLLPQDALLLRSHADSDVLIQHRVLSSRTVIPCASCGAQSIQAGWQEVICRLWS